MAQWYISIYARLANGEVELLSYAEAPNFGVACAAERINLPSPKFYHAENCVGSLLPRFKPYWVARDRYSHKPETAELQIEAELMAQSIIDAKDLFFDSATKAMKKLKPFLTKEQYAATLSALMRKPSVIKYLYEDGAKNTAKEVAK